MREGRGFVSFVSGHLVSPQQFALESLADELFYGGAGGGGKTDLLIGAASTQHRNSIIFRREFKQLTGPGGIIDRTRDVVGDRGEVIQSLARNIDGFRNIEFGSLQLEIDKNKYKGRPHDLKGWDELPEYTESQFRFVNAWLRTSEPGQRCRVIATGNPPTDPEGEWIIKYWGPWLDPMNPNPALPGELRWVAVLEGKDVWVDGPDPVWEEKSQRFIKPRSRTFIPASVEDNVFYMSTGYDQVLDNLPEPLRSQMRFGNFQAKSDDHPWQILPTAWVRAAQERWTEQPPSSALTALGCDPSRGGQDKFCIAARYAFWVDQVTKHEAKEAPDGASGTQLIVNELEKRVGKTYQTVPVGIDIIGSAGSSVYDHSLGREVAAISLNGSEKTEQRDASGKLGFYNKRAEWHWRLREWLDPSSGMDIALPPDRELYVDLCAPRWQMTPRGIKVEAKDEIKARIGRSPDVGEAVIYSFAEDSSAGFGFLKFAHTVATPQTDRLNAAPKTVADLPEEPNEWLAAAGVSSRRSWRD